MRRILGRLVLGAMGLVTLASGCGDDEDSDGSGGSAGTGGSGKGGSSGSSAVGGEAGTPGEGGTTGAAGAGEGGAPAGSDGGSAGAPTSEGGASGSPPSEGGAAGGGSDLDELSTSCDDFPATVEMGPTIAVDTTGAVLCADVCRVTSNTYSDGINPCADEDFILGFFSSEGQNWVRVIGALEIVSTSAGTLDPTFVDDVPAGEGVTVVIENTDTTAEYTVVFEFDESGELTVTSFSENE
jgi:hypothetical protein